MHAIFNERNAQDVLTKDFPNTPGKYMSITTQAHDHLAGHQKSKHTTCLFYDQVSISYSFCKVFFGCICLWNVLN